MKTRQGKGPFAGYSQEPGRSIRELAPFADRSRRHSAPFHLTDKPELLGTDCPRERGPQAARINKTGYCVGCGEWDSNIVNGLGKCCRARFEVLNV